MMTADDLIPVSDIIASVDIARLFRVTPSAVTNWKTRHPDFPAPIAVVGRGRITLYRKSAVLAWYGKRVTPESIALMRELIANYELESGGTP